MLLLSKLMVVVTKHITLRTLASTYVELRWWLVHLNMSELCSENSRIFTVFIRNTCSLIGMCSTKHYVETWTSQLGHSSYLDRMVKY